MRTAKEYVPRCEKVLPSRGSRPTMKPPQPHHRPLWSIIISADG